MQRRRQSPRVFVRWGGVALVGLQRIPCEIVNISLGGAKLRLAGDSVIQNNLVLLCEKFEALDGRVVWREGNTTGIRFTDPYTAATLQPCLRAIFDSPMTVKFGRRRTG